jgi:hypothetical protein
MCYINDISRNDITKIACATSEGISSYDVTTITGAISDACYCGDVI